MIVPNRNNFVALAVVLSLAFVSASHSDAASGVDEIVPEVDSEQLVEQLVPEQSLQQTALYQEELVAPDTHRRQHLVAPISEIQMGAALGSASGSAEVRHWAKFDPRKVWEKELVTQSGGADMDTENALYLKAYAITAVDHAFEVMKMNTKTLSSLGYLLVTLAGYGQKGTQDSCQPGASGVSTPMKRAEALYDMDVEDALATARGAKQDVFTQYRAAIAIVGKRFRFANGGSLGPYILKHIAKAMAQKGGVLRMHKRTKIRLAADTLGLTNELDILSTLAVSYHKFMANVMALQKDPCYAKFYELPVTTHEKAQDALDVGAESTYKVVQEAKYKEGKVKAKVAEARQKAEEAAGKEAAKKAKEASAKLAEKQGKEVAKKAMEAEKDAKADIAEEKAEKKAAAAEVATKAEQEKKAKALAAKLAEAEAAAKAAQSEEEKAKESKAKKTAAELRAKAKKEEQANKEAEKKTAELAEKATAKEKAHKATLSAEAAAKQDEANAKQVAAEKQEKAVAAENEFKTAAKEKKDKAAALAQAEKDDKAKAAAAEKAHKQAEKLKELQKKQEEQDAKEAASEAVSKSEEAVTKETEAKKAAAEVDSKQEVAAKAAAEQEAAKKAKTQKELEAKAAALAAEAKKKAAVESKFKQAEAERKEKADTAEEKETKSEEHQKEVDKKVAAAEAKKKTAAEKNEKAMEEDSSKKEAEKSSKESAKKKEDEAYSKAGEKAGKELKAKAESKELQDKASKEDDEKEKAKKSAEEKKEKELEATKHEAEAKKAAKEAADKAEAAAEAKVKADKKAEIGTKAKEAAEKKEATTKKAEIKAKEEEKEAAEKKTAEERKDKEADAKFVAKQLAEEKRAKAIEKEKNDKAEILAKKEAAKKAEKQQKENAYKEKNAKEGSRESSAKLRIQCAVSGPGVVPGQPQGCTFPFEFGGKMHDRCITEGQGDGKKPWCAIATSRRGVFLTGKWGYCGDCPGLLNTTEIMYSYALKVETGTLIGSETTQLPKIVLEGSKGTEYELDTMKLPHAGATRIIPFYSTKDIGTVKKVRVEATSTDPWFFTNFQVQTGFFGKWVPFGPSNWWLVQQPFKEASSYAGDGYGDSLRLTPLPKGAVNKMGPCDENAENLGTVCNPWTFGQNEDGDMGFYYNGAAQVILNKEGDLWSKRAKGYMATLEVSGRPVVAPGDPTGTDQIAGDWVLGESSNGNFGLWMHVGEKFMPKLVVDHAGDIYTSAEPTKPLKARNQKMEQIGMPRPNAATTPSEAGWQIGLATATTKKLGIWKHGLLKAFITSDGDIWGAGAGGYMKQSTFTSANPGPLLETFSLPELEATQDMGDGAEEPAGSGLEPHDLPTQIPFAGHGYGSGNAENTELVGLDKEINDVFFKP